MGKGFVCLKPPGKNLVIHSQYAAHSIRHADIKIIMLSQKLDFIRGYTKRLSPEVNPGSVLLLNHVQLFAAAVHTCPYQSGRTGSLFRQALYVADQNVIRPLVFKDMMLGLHILFHGTVMVQMLLMDVHQNSYMG